MNVSGEMQMLMVTLDVTRARELWREKFSHLPQPKSDEEMLATLHIARTQSEIITDKLRYYSHAWLRERGLPTHLPDHMRQPAERMYPVNVPCVGISINTKSDLMRPIVPLVRGAMENAVLEAYADGHAAEPVLIKGRMMEARKTTVRKLLGVK
jgi:hypothetical protein